MIKQVYYNNKRIKKIYFNGKDFSLAMTQTQPTYIPVTQIIVEPKNILLKANEQIQLRVTVLPENATNRKIVWESSNTGFATVTEDGMVTAYLDGQLEIVAKSADNNIQDTTIVTVESSPIEDVDTDITETTGIGITNEIKEMIVGEDIGLMVRVLPHSWSRDNTCLFESSDDTIASVKSSVITAKRPGKVTITARTKDKKYVDQVTFNVVEPVLEKILPIEEYLIEINKFNIVSGNVDQRQALLNTRGINYALLYAQNKKYKKVILPKDTYYIYPTESIYGRSDLIFDLNDSTIQILENKANAYAAISFKEGPTPNILDQLSFEVDGEILNKDRLGNTAIDLVGWEVKDSINKEVRTSKINIKSISESIIENYIKPGIKYNLTFEFGRKDMVIDATTTKRVDSNLYIEYYKDNIAVKKEKIGSLWAGNSIVDGTSTSKNIKSFTVPIDIKYDQACFVFENILNNVTTTVYIAQMYLGVEVNKVLENFKLCNGTVIGERDAKSKVYPEWWNVAKTEGGCTIVFEEGKFNGIENMTIKKSVGFNMSSSPGMAAYGTVKLQKNNAIVCSNLEFGNFNEYGEKIDSQDVIRTITPIKVNNLTEYYSLDLPLGYMGYQYENSRIYDIYFYDQENRLIETQKCRLKFGQYTLPPNSYYAHVVFHTKVLPVNGNSDFWNAVISINSYRPPYKNFIKNCIISDNYSTGLALCGGVNWLLEGNRFFNNTGRMPSCDIDWEDGWEFMQNDVIRNNSFESYKGVIVCAGSNFVFKNNVLKGNDTFWGRSQDMKIINNTFDGTGKEYISKDFATQSNIYVDNNTFINAYISISKQHTDSAYYKATFATNKFIDSTPKNLFLSVFKNTQFEFTKAYTIGRAKTEGIKALNCSFKGVKDKLLLIQNSMFTSFENCSFEDMKMTTYYQFVPVPREISFLQSFFKDFVLNANGETLEFDQCTFYTVNRTLLITSERLKIDLTIKSCEMILENPIADLVFINSMNDCNGAINLVDTQITSMSGSTGYILRGTYYPTGGKVLNVNLTNTPTQLPLSDSKGLANNFIKFNVN